MAYKWRPSASQRKAFAEKMQNPVEREMYEARKAEKAKKRRENSRYDYESAGGMYVPTRAQHDFAVFDRPGDLTSEQECACNMVASAYACNEKVDHDYIHVVNELMRKQVVY